MSSNERPASCFYEGTVHHRRAQPAVAFRHRLVLALIDLDELPGLLAGQLVRPGFGLLRFRRGDYLGDPGVSLAEAVRELVLERTGRRPSGPVRLLGGLRSFGTCFNPVSFYYCLDEAGESIEALLAEVTNTPWGERHAYVLPGGHGSELSARFAKSLHVSPFMSMDHEYTCHAGLPGQSAAVHVQSRRDGELAFEATLSLRRMEMTPSSARRVALRYPLAGLRTLALIYGHAVGLKLRGAAYFPHPSSETA